MKTKKTYQVDLEKKRNFFLLIGFTIVLAVILTAFEWKAETKSSSTLSADWGIEESDIIPITRIVEPPKPIVKKKVIVKFELVDNKTKVAPQNFDWLDNIEDPVYEPEPEELIEEKTGVIDWAIVQNKPEFIGGMNALMNFVARNTKYPQLAKENGIEGTVYVEFVVGKDGRVKDAKIARSVDPYLDKEALRVVNIIPKWKPGSQRGKNVDVRYYFPFKFELNN
jgi:protein TonB